MFELSEAQRQVVESKAALVVVSAGAGTGKTRTLTARCAHLLRSSPEVGRVLAVTFSVAATREMRSRLEAMGVAPDERLHVCTLHSLSYRLCVQAGVLPKVGAGSGLLSEDEEVSWIRQALDGDSQFADVSLPVGHRKDHEPLEVALARLFRRWADNGFDAESGLGTLPRDFDPRLAEMFGSLVSWKRQTGRFGFSDLAVFASACLESTHGKNEDKREGSSLIPWTDWDHVLVDEAQDLNAAQSRLLRRLSGESKSLTLVGDEDQCLYGFRGAMASLLAEAEREFPSLAAKGCERVFLGENRRSTDNILSPAVRVIRNNRGRQAKLLASGVVGPDPEAFLLPDQKDEVDFVCHRVQSLLVSGVSPKDVAILSRTMAPLSLFESSLLALRIPVSLRCGNSMIESSMCRDILAWISLALESDATDAFLRVHDRPPRGIGDRLADSVVSLVERHDLSLPDALLELSRKHPETDKLARILLEMEETVKSGESVFHIIRHMLAHVGYLTWAEAHHGKAACDRMMSVIETLSGDCSDLYDFMHTVCLSRDTDIPADNGAVCLMTIHAAKGLEWSHVFVVDAHGLSLPHASAMEEEGLVRRKWPSALLRGSSWLTIGRGGMEEERRLFHVALTRARESVCITAPCVLGWGSNRIETPPSAIIREAGIAPKKLDRNWRREFGLDIGNKTLRQAWKGTRKNSMNKTLQGSFL